MKNKRGLLIILMVFVLLMAGAYILYQHLGQQAAPDQLAVQQTQTEPTKPTDPVPSEGATEQEEEPVKIPAPDFTVYDSEGNEIHLSDFAGKPVVINFWASWCGPCKRELPHFEEAYQELGEDVHFLMINLTNGRETMDNALGLIQEEGYTFPVFYDTHANAAYVYGLRSVPTTYFIDAEGNAVMQIVGIIDKDTLMRSIDMIQ